MVGIWLSSLGAPAALWWHNWRDSARITSFFKAERVSPASLENNQRHFNMDGALLGYKTLPKQMDERTHV
jgi:hypothetical protein